MLTVYNVGQGDSFLLEPPKGCLYSEKPLLIDAGPSTGKVASKISHERLSILLTHSHSDHIGGLPSLLKTKAIHRLYLPYYLPEVISISQYLKKHIKVKIGSPNWKKINALQPLLVGDGDSLCNHMKVLNPPKDPFLCFSELAFRRSGAATDEREPIKESIDNVEQALNFLLRFIPDLPVVDIDRYQSPLTNYEVVGLPKKPDDQTADYSASARKFVHHFFISVANRLQNAAGEGILNSDALQYHLDGHLTLAANQASVVFIYENHGGNWFFTGDADEVVFDRILSRRISCKYLKVPHHGSRENLSTHTLKIIAPEVAIISHKNRKFGRSKDPHPHHEVIDLLDRLGIRSYYTNDVIKGGKIIKEKAGASVEKGLISFVQ